MDVTIEARPDAITIDPGQTAVLVVDMQNDFGAKGGMLDLAGVDISPNQAVIEPTGRLLMAARQGGITVVYLKMGYRPDLSDLGAAETPNRIRHPSVGTMVATPDGRASRILIRDTGTLPSSTSSAPRRPMSCSTRRATAASTAPISTPFSAVVA
jgi:nicotinamidase-related amidase